MNRNLSAKLELLNDVHTVKFFRIHGLHFYIVTKYITEY